MQGEQEKGGDEEQGKNPTPASTKRTRRLSLPQQPCDPDVPMHDPQSPLPASYAPVQGMRPKGAPFSTPWHQTRPLTIPSACMHHASRTSLMHEPAAPAHLPTRLLGQPLPPKLSSSTMRPRRSPRMTLKTSCDPDISHAYTPARAPFPRPPTPNEPANSPFLMSHASHTSLMHEPGAPPNETPRAAYLPSPQTVSSSSTVRPRRPPCMTLKAFCFTWT